jgi:hypothetical protein
MKSQKSVWMSVCLVIVSVLISAACSKDGSNLTGPSSQIPNVAGNYAGTTTITYPELGQTLTCPTTTAVTQGPNGQISMAPAQLGGQCGGVSVPLGNMTIDATGSLGQASGSYTESCGIYNWTASGGFFGRSLQASFAYTSRTCYNFTVTFNLTH